MVHDPTLVRWTVDPVTVQFPVAVKLTVRLEEAVALTVKSGLPKTFAGSAPNVTV